MKSPAVKKSGMANNFSGFNKLIKLNFQLNRKKKKTILFRINAFAFFLILVGVIGTVPTLYFKMTGNGTSSQKIPLNLVHTNKPMVKPPNIISGYPEDLQIPSLNFNLTIIPGYYNQTTGTWNLTNTEAQFATPSVVPNNYYGNTLIYGHDRTAVFASLNLIQLNSLAYVTTKNGYRFNYQYQYTYAVNPSNTSIFDYQGAPILTLQTCSGNFYQNRQMYVFKYLGYDKLPLQS